MRSQQLIYLTHKNIYILPTKQGLVFAALLCLMLLGSVNYSNNLGYLLTFLLFGVSMISIIHVYRNMFALSIQCGRCNPVFAGEQARFTLSIRNPKPVDRFEIIVQPQNTPTHSITSVKAEHTDTVILPITTQHRGYLSLPKLKITSSFPLGLFFAWSNLSLSMRCLVYPKPDNSTQPLPHDLNLGSKGTAVQAGTDDFLGFRRAQPADPPKHLNWKGFAKGQGLMAKQFGSHLDQHLWLDWEHIATHSMEAKIARLCQWVMEAERQQVAYGLVLPGMRLAPDLGPNHRHQCLKALALFQQR